MPVRIDEPRHDDHVAGVDHFCRRAYVRLDRYDLRSLDQDIGLIKVANGRIERKDSPAFE